MIEGVKWEEQINKSGWLSMGSSWHEPSSRGWSAQAAGRTHTHTQTLWTPSLQLLSPSRHSCCFGFWPVKTHDSPAPGLGPPVSASLENCLVTSTRSSLTGNLLHAGVEGCLLIFRLLPCGPCCWGPTEPACWTDPPPMAACCRAEALLIMVPGPGCPGATGPAGLHLERPFPKATAPTNVLVSAGLKYCLFWRSARKGTQH